jgi:cytoskeletal protein RodZ
MAILLPERIDVAAFGEFLRIARERRGLTLEQIANETRIPRRHLDAIEHGNLDAVPSGMYRRAEIRAYADAVGLDRSLALAHLEHALQSSVAPAATTPADPADDGLTRVRWRALGAIAVVAGTTMFAVSLWNGERPRAAVDDAPAISDSAAPVAPAVPPPAPPVQAAPTPVPVATAIAPVATRDVAAAVDTDVALTITSDPPGARVVVDGIGRGTTPLTVDNVTGGARRVRVIKDGFLSQERVVRVGAGSQPTTLHVALDAVH